MTTDELMDALEQDLAQKGVPLPADRAVVLARYSIQNAAVAARGAECALVACKPPAVAEAVQAAQVAMQSLRHALILLATVEIKHE